MKHLKSIRENVVTTSEFTFDRLPFQLRANKAPMFISFAVMLLSVIVAQHAFYLSRTQGFLSSYGEQSTLVAFVSIATALAVITYTIRDFFKTCATSYRMTTLCSLGNLWLLNGAASNLDLSARIQIQQCKFTYMRSMPCGTGLKLYAIASDEQASEPYLLETDILETGEVKSTVYKNKLDIRSMLVPAFGDQSGRLAEKLGIELEKKPLHGATKIAPPASQSATLQAGKQPAPLMAPLPNFKPQAERIEPTKSELEYTFHSDDFDGFDEPVEGVFGQSTRLRSGARNRPATHNFATA